MNYIYSITYDSTDSLSKGIKLGCIVGILWVFPHGLAMAAIHATSLVYEFKNTLYHIIEQGIGGVIVFFLSNYFNRKI